MLTLLDSNRDLLLVLIKSLIILLSGEKTSVVNGLTVIGYSCVSYITVCPSGSFINNSVFSIFNSKISV